MRNVMAVILSERTVC